MPSYPAVSKPTAAIRVGRAERHLAGAFASRTSSLEPLLDRRLDAEDQKLTSSTRPFPASADKKSNHALSVSAMKGRWSCPGFVDA